MLPNVRLNNLGEAKLIDYLKYISGLNVKSEKLLFFESPPHCGIDKMVEYISNNFNFDLVQESNDQNQIKKLIYNIVSIANKTIKKFNLVPNFPLEMYVEMFNDHKLTKEKVLLDDLVKKIQVLLNKENSSEIIVFFWDDGTCDRFKNKLESLFGSKIMSHKYTKVINVYKIKTYKKIVKRILYRLNMSDQLDYEYVAQMTDGNLLKLKYFIQNENMKFKHSLSQQENMYQNNKIVFSPMSQDLVSKKLVKNEEEESDMFSFFHALGKILYNKRIDRTTGKTRGMSKKELTTKPIPELYFNIEEIVDNVKGTLKSFNETLIENSFDHFRDLKELGSALDTFSLLDKVGRVRSQDYLYEEMSIKKLQSVITAMGVAHLNKSQYEGKKIPGFKKLNTPKYSYKFKDKSVIKEIYHRVIQKNPVVSSISFNRFSLDILPLIQILQKKKTLATNTRNKYFHDRLDVIEETEEKEIYNETKHKNNDKFSNKTLTCLYNCNQENELSLEYVLDNIDEFLLNYEELNCEVEEFDSNVDQFDD